MTQPRDDAGVTAEELSVIRVALERIEHGATEDGGPCHCECDTEDCCEKVDEYCVQCIARGALKLLASLQSATPSDRGTAWLIEREGNEWMFPVILANGASIEWSGDANKALRFARKQDAESALLLLSRLTNIYSNRGVRVTEHAWVMKVRTDFHSVNLSTGERTRSIVGDGENRNEVVRAALTRHGEPPQGAPIFEAIYKQDEGGNSVITRLQEEVEFNKGRAGSVLVTYSSLTHADLRKILDAFLNQAPCPTEPPQGFEQWFRAALREPPQAQGHWYSANNHTALSAEPETPVDAEEDCYGCIVAEIKTVLSNASMGNEYADMLRIRKIIERTEPAEPRTEEKKP